MTNSEMASADFEVMRPRALQAEDELERVKNAASKRRWHKFWSGMRRTSGTISTPKSRKVWRDTPEYAAIMDALNEHGWKLRSVGHSYMWVDANARHFIAGLVLDVLHARVSSVDEKDVETERLVDRMWDEPTDGEADCE